jgi:hypothetical protein
MTPLAVVLLLIVAVIGLFYALSHSLRRLRRNVDNGSFKQDASHEPGGPGDKQP